MPDTRSGIAYMRTSPLPSCPLKKFLPQLYFFITYIPQIRQEKLPPYHLLTNVSGKVRSFVVQRRVRSIFWSTILKQI